MSRLLLAIALLCAPLLAEPLKVGDDAADFEAQNWMNPPARSSFAEWRGDVILFFAWNKDSEAAVKQLPAVNLHAAKPGLHVIGLYTGVHKFAELEAAIAKHKITYPMALDSFWPAGYAATTLPRFWVIGADGKVKFVGESEYEPALAEELAKVKYPGLGRDKVCAALEPAAQLYGQRKFALALAAAQKALDATEDKTEEADADYIIKRIEGRARELAQRADTAENDRNFSLAISCWSELGSYAGVEEAADAPARLKRLNTDAAVKKELASRRALISLGYDRAMEFRKINKDDPKQLRKFREGSLAAYKKFATDHKGTAAADRATELADTFTELLAEPDAEPEK